MLLSSSSVPSLLHGLLSCAVLCCALSVLPQVYFHVLRVASQVTKFENFVAEMLAFLWCAV